MKNKFIIINILFGFLLCQMKAEYTNPILKSAILPGWGELDLNNNKRSNQFFIQEASIWITYFGLQYVSNSYESDYRAFASLHAGVDMIDKSYQYSVDIGDYNTYEEFIDAKILAPRMQFIKNWRPEDWHLAFLGDLHLIPKNDFNLIEDEMQRLIDKRSNKSYKNN